MRSRAQAGQHDCKPRTFKVHTRRPAQYEPLVSGHDNHLVSNGHLQPPQSHHRERLAHDMPHACARIHTFVMLPNALSRPRTVRRHASTLSVENMWFAVATLPMRASWSMPACTQEAAKQTRAGHVVGRAAHRGAVTATLADSAYLATPEVVVLVLIVTKSPVPVVEATSAAIEPLCAATEGHGAATLQPCGQSHNVLP